MSAELLHEAAALMRKRAEAATPGPWHGFPPEAPSETQQVVWAGQATVAEVSMPIPPEFGLDGLADRDHIASWHPAVALAVADWLDAQGNEYEANEAIWAVSSLDPENRWEERDLTVEANLEHHHKSALDVARAYLGRDA